MNKLLLMLVGLSLLMFSCGKDEETTEPIDKFIGDFVGSFKEYTCEANQVLLNTQENIAVKINKEDDSNLNGTLKTSSGVTILSFSGSLDDNKINISQFVYESDTLFGGGEIISDKLTLQFASKLCPSGTNSFLVTREFKEN